jgi:hypothetical protein
MQSNAQYGQPQIMGQGQQEAMHQAMLAQQQQYNNQAAQIASQPKGIGSMGGMNPVMLAQALRKVMDQKPEMMGNQQTPNWQNPYASYDQSGGTNYGAGSTGGTGIE